MWSDGSLLPLDSELWRERNKEHLASHDTRDCVAADRRNGEPALYDTGCTDRDRKSFVCQLHLPEIKGTLRLCYTYLNSAGSYLL